MRPSEKKSKQVEETVRAKVQRMLSNIQLYDHRNKMYTSLLFYGEAYRS